MISLLIGLLLIALILGLFYWVFTQVPILAPFAPVVFVVVVVIFVIFVIVALLPLAGVRLQHSWLIQ
jgi:hypothetical protein